MNLLFVTFLFLSSRFAISSTDQHDSCREWADAGECVTNPGFMLVSCPESCSRPEIESNFVSLYDIVETDINGKEFSFDMFKGSIVYIVNVASQCGYTAENYEMFRKLSKYRDDGVQMVLAPCNQFGRQEPGDATSISKFATSQQYDGIILSKMDVNGPETRPIFSYLKKVTGKRSISWNFDGKFLCDREGRCFVPSSDVEDDIIALIQQKEL